MKTTSACCRQIDPRLWRDSRYQGLSLSAQIVWYHLVHNAAYHGLDAEQIREALLELGDDALLRHLQAFLTSAGRGAGRPTVGRAGRLGGAAGRTRIRG